MSFRRPFDLILTCLLTISLLANSASMASYVWCVNADGDHSTLEFTPAGDCFQGECVPPTGHVTAATLAEKDDDCGPCLDISSSHQGNISRSRHGEFSVEVPAGTITPALMVSRLLLPESILNTPGIVAFPPRIPEPILLHRTTVLLI